MADEAAVNLIMRMRDEASDDIANLGGTMANTEMQALKMNVALTAMGGALSSVGSLLNQIDSPMAKMAGTFLTMAGAIMMSVSAIIVMVPEINKLIKALRSMAIAQSIVAALTGPVGWARIGIGLGVAAAATAGIVGMTGGFSGGGTTNVNINAGVLMADSTQAKQLARMVKRNIDEDTRLGR